MAKMKVVLAYSGGLDTTIIIPWLKENYDCEVIAVAADVGQGEELAPLNEKAIKSGAAKIYIEDLKDEFVRDCVLPTIKANAVYEGKYLLGTSFARPVIAKRLVEIAKREGADAICHGCTGKGNDQVRFEASILMLDPELDIIAPVRDWDLVSREDEMAWAEAHGIDVPTTKASPYSIDDNLWGRAIECGVLEDPWAEPPADIYTMTVGAQEAPDEPTYVEVSFEHGIPCAIDGKKMSYLDIIYAMNGIAGSNGFGRLDMIENRLVGVKSRECYEVPGALALIQAHKALEDLCLERSVLHFKLGIEQAWAEQVYNGLWFSPLKEALDAFLADTQQCVTGTVRLKFYKGGCTVVGRTSDYSLYDFELATYNADDEFDHQAAKGFIDLHALTCKVWAKNRLSMGARMHQFDAVDSTTDEFEEASSMASMLEEAEAVTKDAASVLG